MTKIIGTQTIDDALTALGEEVVRHERAGERTLIFCEDRLTLLAEKAVLAACGGTFLTEVTTFRRFLTQHSNARGTLSKQGSVLEIAALMERHAGELGCFRRSAAQAVYETIAQLSASCVSEEELRTCAAETEGMLSRKLSDLAFLFESYHAFLAERGLLDENGYLALLPTLIQTLGDVHILFFAFPSFTKQGRACIRAAVRSALSTTGIFLAGKEVYYTNEAAQVFAKTAEECGSVQRIVRGGSLAGDAVLLHGALFSTERIAERKQATHVCIFSPQNESEEMNEIAALIKRHTAEGKRYRDMAVLVGSEEYLAAAEKAFRAYRIPYYADVKRKFSSHPFAAFCLDVLEAAADGALPEEADAVASSVYFGEGALYRNYLLRFCAYRGGVRREIKGDEERGFEFGDYAHLAACRERMLHILDLFKLKKRAKAKDYTEGIRKLRTLVGEKEVTERLAQRLPVEERALMDLAPIEIILSEIEDIVGEEPFAPREFASLLRSGMDAFSVSVLPHRTDAVFVGDITESKICRAEILFCAGLSETVPRISQDTAVITDGELERLGRLQVEIDPAICVVNARAREALALNLCAFSERLYLSCPARIGGAAANRSELFYYLEKALETAPMPEIYPYDRSEFAPALLAFYRDIDARLAENDVRADERIARYSSLRALLMAPVKEDWQRTDPELARVCGNKTPSPEAGSLMLRGEVSPTRLEDYFKCPYQGFALRGLRLSDREERSPLDPSDTGTFVHAVLENVAASFNDFASEAECEAKAREWAELLLQSPRYAAITDTAAGAFSGERLVGEAAEVTVQAYRQLRYSAYTVKATESAVAIPHLHLAGKVDRVDVSGDRVRIIDYKTGSFDTKPEAYYTGRKLQLELYLRAASEGGMSAGAFYFPAQDDYISEKDDGKFRMQGFYCKDPEITEGFDTLRAPGEKSEFYESGSRTRAFSRTDFEAFLDYAELVAAQAEREMGAGNLIPSPYMRACDYCKLKGMCGFTGAPREEKGVSFAEIVNIAKKCRGQDHE